MFRVKRVKSVEVLEGDAKIVKPATHYAAAVLANGTVARWDASPARSVPITAGVARRVEAAYKARPQAGTIVVESMTVAPGDIANVVADCEGVDAAEFQRLQDHCRLLDARVREAEQDRDAARREADSAASRANGLAAKAQECIELTAKVHSLEGLLSEAKAEKVKTDAESASAEGAKGPRVSK